jgi:hypothetical protein
MSTKTHPLPFRGFVVPPKLPEPIGLLTMIVSLEAIFLSTFVMISQNRADAKRQDIADQQWQTVQEEDQQNRQLLDLSEQILELTKAVHAYAQAATAAGGTAGTRDAGAYGRAAESMVGVHASPVVTGPLGRGKMAPGGPTSTGNATG